MTRTVAIASDHAGFPHKDAIVVHLRERGEAVLDLGPDTSEVSVDYPDYAHLVADAVASGSADVGVLVCGTGIGMAIAANKVSGVRAANVTTPEFAQLTRQHNDANVVALSGRFTDLPTNLTIVDTFLDTPFEGGRHANRVGRIERSEQ